MLRKDLWALAVVIVLSGVGLGGVFSIGSIFYPVPRWQCLGPVPEHPVKILGGESLLRGDSHDCDYRVFIETASGRVYKHQSNLNPPWALVERPELVASWLDRGLRAEKGSRLPAGAIDDCEITWGGSAVHGSAQYVIFSDGSLWRRTAYAYEADDTAVCCLGPLLGLVAGLVLATLIVLWRSKQSGAIAGGAR